MKKENYNCPDTETLLAFSEGILKSDIMGSVNEHLMDCDLCLKEVFIMKRALKATEGKTFPLPEELKEKALIAATGESVVERSVKYLSEFVLSVTERGISYVSNLILPEGATLNVYSPSIPVEEFRSGENKEGESIIIEESLRGIKLKVVLLHTRGPFVTIGVSLMKNGNFIDDKRITLYQNESLLSSKITSGEGSVEFSDLSYGYYSIRVPSEDIELRFRLHPEETGET